jgi:hypothetical protein
MLLSQFERQMERSEGVTYLADALAWLAVVATDARAAALWPTCNDIVTTYALKVQEKVQPILTQESPVPLETFNHWCRVFAEFERSGFALPASVTQCSTQVFSRWFTQRYPSVEEQQQYLQLLQDRVDRIRSRGQQG